MSEIQVLKVVDNRVRMRVGNVIFTFGPNGNGGVRVVSRHKEGVQMSDPNQLWVSDYLFSAACPSGSGNP